MVCGAWPWGCAPRLRVRATAAELCGAGHWS
nr:MAG TPA: hypothetical protein [Caudoviricetes sp.]